jgi:Protein tyrosine and serine/threonine kinase
LRSLPCPGAVSPVMAYAEKLADGFRQPIPAAWPEKVRTLVSDCWQQKPRKRPSAADVLARLKEIQELGIDVEWDVQEGAPAPSPKAAARQGDGGCCCTIS